MASRTPPAWFVRKLRALDKAFMVKWDDVKSRWVISEGVPWAVRVCTDPVCITTTYPRPHRLFWVAGDLGSHVLDWVKRSMTRRFETVEQMTRELDIDKEKDVNRKATGFAQTAFG